MYIQFFYLLCLLGFLSISMATQCYVCTADDSCSDAYSADDGHDMDCDANIAYTEDGGCSKQKTKTKVLGILVSTGKFQATVQFILPVFTSFLCIEPSRKL